MISKSLLHIISRTEKFEPRNLTPTTTKAQFPNENRALYTSASHAQPEHLEKGRVSPNNPPNSKAHPKKPNYKTIKASTKPSTYLNILYLGIFSFADQSNPMQI